LISSFCDSLPPIEDCKISVPLQIKGKPKNVVLSDQIKSLDWCERKVEFKGRISAMELAEIRRKAALLLGVV
ncbi:hypothetical protein P9097_12110, partial [Gallibacterium anatis]